jgi:hypothetical protein
MRWFWIAAVLCAVALAGYLTIDAGPRPRGGTWYGYLLGTIGALLIVWLTLFGVRKRWITSGAWSLKGWLSAHVYLGLALLVIATLHTGLHFGWNVHTLAYVLMLLVIASGVFGVVNYVRLPRRLSENRQDTTQAQLLELVRSLDVQLREAAQPLDRREAEIVRLSVERTKMTGSAWERLTGVYRGCGNQRAIDELGAFLRPAPKGKLARLEAVAALLERKQQTLDQMRRHVRLRSILEVWLFVHVPATFALLAALTAHIVSEFIYW